MLSTSIENELTNGLHAPAENSEFFCNSNELYINMVPLRVVGGNPCRNTRNNKYT
jgi:hypothetical protein